MSDKFIARYVDVLHAVLDAPEQLPAIAIRDALRLVARPLGYQVHPNDGKISSTTRAVLSRDVFELFPEKWVTQTFPCCARPSDTKVQFWLDGTLWMKTPSTSVAGYALAAAMLFKSGDVFMHAVRHGQLDDGSLTSAESEKGPRVRWALLQSSKEANAAAETNEQAQGRGVGRGRRLTAAAKAAVVQRTYDPGMSVKRISKETGIAKSALYEWRKLERVGAFGPPCNRVSEDQSDLAAARAEIFRLRLLLESAQMENEALKDVIRLATVRA